MLPPSCAEASAGSGENVLRRESQWPARIPKARAGNCRADVTWLPRRPSLSRTGSGVRILQRWLPENGAVWPYQRFLRSASSKSKYGLKSAPAPGQRESGGEITILPKLQWKLACRLMLSSTQLRAAMLLYLLYVTKNNGEPLVGACATADKHILSSALSLTKIGHGRGMGLFCSAFRSYCIT